MEVPVMLATCTLLSQKLTCSFSSHKSLVQHSISVNLFVEQIGAIQSIRIVLDPITKESRGYAYVNFFVDSNRNPVEEAISRLNYTEVKGQQIIVMFPEKDPEKRRKGEGNVFVKGLEPEIDSHTLHLTFEVFGFVSSAKVVRDSNGKSLGYGYVQFVNSEAADEAVTRANNMMLKERMISVERFKPKHERRNQSYTNLFIKNFPSSIQKEDHLIALFSKFGNITSSFLPMKEGGGVKGFGFINFKETESAIAATKEMHEKEVDGAILYVQRAQTRAERKKFLESRYREQKRIREKEYKGRNLYVKNFSKDTTDDDLFRLFSQFGTITSSKVMMENGQSRGFGFVCFATAKEASTALNAMNGLVVGDKTLYVNVAQSREERRSILRRLRSTVSFHAAAAAFSGQPYYYSPSMPVPPVSLLSPIGQSLDYSPGSPVVSPYSSTPYPLPMMVPPALVDASDKALKQDQAKGSRVKGWELDAKQTIDDFHFESTVEKNSGPYAGIPSRLSCGLYVKVSQQQTNERLAQKITGMLLDLGIEEVEDSILVLKNAGMINEPSNPQENYLQEVIKT